MTRRQKIYRLGAVLAAVALADSFVDALAESENGRQFDREVVEDFFDEKCGER